MAASTVPVPVNPLTLQINLTVLRFVASQFLAKWMPTMEAVVTSELRSADHNESVGGVPDSAHLYGLAQDFQLRYKANKALVPEAQAKQIFTSVIAPNWPGFAEWEGSSTGEGYHIHWNLSRDISTYAGIMAIAGVGVVGFAIINSWGNNHG